MSRQGLALMLLGIESAFAAGSPCDPDLKPPADTPYAYRLRGELCEGIYTRDVAGKSLNLVSLTESVEDFTPSVNKDLLIEWVAPENAAIHLRAEALRPRLYYRMDANPSALRRSLTWAPNLLKELQLTRSEVGLLGWTARMIGKDERRVYVPLRLSQQQASRRSSSFRLVVLPGSDMDEVFVSVSPVKQDGGLGPPIIEDKALDRGYYPAERPVVIDLPSLATAGIYVLEVGAKLRGGGSAAEKIWMYSSGM